jgi:hypothetical protein
VIPRELEEYKALRATIRERGTARSWILLVGFIGWAGSTLATAALAQLPVATLLPLFLLAATFEIAFSLFTGIERIGRFIQVVHENEEIDRGWESYAMAYARSFHVRGSDPLMATYFWIATFFNFVPALAAGPVPLEWGTVGAMHLLFAVRIFVARREAAQQRATDLERFRHLKERR